MAIEQRNLAEALVLARRRLGLTQQQVADAVGVSRMTISRIERGDDSVSYATIAAMAATMGLEVTTEPAAGR